LHNLRARQHRGNDFMKVPFANSSALSQLPVFLNSLAITDTAVPPIHAPFTPVHHSVTKQYYRQLSAEEAATFGFTSPTIRKQERRISQ
ncbi:endonuclease, partial [Bacteroides xylanisolvens]